MVGVPGLGDVRVLDRAVVADLLADALHAQPADEERRARTSTNANAAPAAMSIAITIDHRPGTPTRRGGCRRPLEPDGPAPLHQHRVAGAQHRHEPGERFDRVGHGVRVGSAGVAAVGDRRAARADADHDVDTELRGALAHGAVCLVVVRAELAHVAEHGDPPSADGQLEMRERHRGGFHRGRDWRCTRR